MDRPASLKIAGFSQPHDVVILLHGLFATSKSMRTAKECLEDSGYTVINWGYPTFWRSIEKLTHGLLPTIKHLQSEPAVKSINFVTHSMGGILVRYALQIGSLAKIRRVVMMAPPNAGSHLTRVSLGPFRKFLPAIAELTESQDSLPNRLVDPNSVEFGVIAAEEDFVVKVPNTHLANQKDHCVLQTTHYALPKHEEALRKAVRFLKSGYFERPVACERPMIRKMAA